MVLLPLLPGYQGLLAALNVLLVYEYMNTQEHIKIVNKVRINSP